jgi:hypothetical protein
MKSRGLKLVLALLTLGVALVGLGPNEAAAAWPGPVCEEGDDAYCDFLCRDTNGRGWGRCDDTIYPGNKICVCTVLLYPGES